jgi:transketolase C-terminal domain/subunit
LGDSGMIFSIERLGVPDAFVEHGPADRLRSKYGLDASGIVAAAKRMMIKM